jgi:predicted enzyme related to lactoylglutathione lyase
MKRYQHGQFSWADYHADDLAQARDFYAGLFGWKPDTRDSPGGSGYVVFRRGGKSVAGMGDLTGATKPRSMPPVWNHYVHVNHIEGVVKAAVDAGGHVVLEPTAILAAGQVAGIADPSGGTTYLWQAGSHTGADLRDNVGAAAWNELLTHDVDGARDFYGKVFGWQFKKVSGRATRTLFCTVNGKINGSLTDMGNDWGDSPPHWLLYIRVADVSQSAARAKELGGRVCVEPADTPFGRAAIVNDSRGAMFGLTNAP